MTTDTKKLRELQELLEKGTQEIRDRLEDGRMNVRVTTENVSVLLDAIDALRAERDRMREALEKIDHGDGIYGMQAGEYKQIARAALGETK